MLGREQLEIVERRNPTVPESYAMPSESVVLRCRTGVNELELAMRRDTRTGSSPGSNRPHPAPTRRPRGSHPPGFQSTSQSGLRPGTDERQVGKRLR